MSKKMVMTVIVLGLLVMVIGGLRLKTVRCVRRAEAAYPPAGRFVEVDGLRLHYVSEGDGRPVVLIHGDGGSIYDWTASVFDRVAESYHAVALDRPGLGYSERPPEGGSPFVQARVLRKALASLGIEDPVLVGHSRGGNVALAYAIRYPNDVAGLVTLAAAPYGGRIALHNRVLGVPVLGPFLAYTVAVPFGRGAVEAGLAAAFEPEGPPPPEYVDAYAAYELRPGQLLSHADDQVRGRAAVAELTRGYEGLHTPLVIVHGTADGMVPIDQARRLHEVAPRSRLLTIDGGGHEIMFTHPAAMMDAVEMAWRMTGSSSDGGVRMGATWEE